MDKSTQPYSEMPGIDQQDAMSDDERAEAASIINAGHDEQHAKYLTEQEAEREYEAAMEAYIAGAGPKPTR